MPIDSLVSPVRSTEHRGNDDLLSAGLGLSGLRGAPVPFADPSAPTPEELRRRAIQSNWKGIADLGPLGAYGELYGSVAHVPGREYQAFAKLPHARSPHRVLLQVPDHFDLQARCLVVTASSGSRGIYGAIAVAAPCALPRGCAVAYTDKGAGTGYFDVASATGTTLEGPRASAGSAALEFDLDAYTSKNYAPLIAVKHAHSGDNPEGDWGRHVLQAAQFGLAMLDRAFPQSAPFTPQNTRIIALGLSNGGGAVLQAAGVDDDNILSSVIALAPNVHTPNDDPNSPASDYTLEGALLLPCALTGARFAQVPFARVQGNVPPAWAVRGAGLKQHGLIGATESSAQAAEAFERLRADGWTDAAIETAATSTAFDAWRAIAATYASAYTRASVGAMPGGYRFTLHDAAGAPRAATAVERAAWWSDAGGIPPGAGVFLDEGEAGDSTDPTLNGLLQLRALWSGNNVQATTLRESVRATAARLPRKDLPLWVIHGLGDGLLPISFTSDPYVAWLRDAGRTPIYWPLAHAQHFDAFLALPGFGDRYVPLLPYGYAAFEHMFAHLVHGAALNPGGVPDVTMRGAATVNATHLGLAQRASVA